MMRDMYLHPSRGFVSSTLLLKKGDLLGTWGYIMTIQPMLEGLSSLLEGKK
jgi:hypothetical protein